MTKKTEWLTAERARELLDYDPITGIFRWKESRGGMLKGSLAGHLQVFPKGHVYWVIRIDNVLHLAHRVAWLMVTGSFPVEILDHKSGVEYDNSWENLRPATQLQNCHNRVATKSNKSGHKGVSWDKLNQKWVARIKKPNGPYLNLGRFLELQDAANAYNAAELIYFGEFAGQNR